jgi:hypothetical protein
LALTQHLLLLLLLQRVLLLLLLQRVLLVVSGPLGAAAAAAAVCHDLQPKLKQPFVGCVMFWRYCTRITPMLNWVLLTVRQRSMLHAANPRQHE